MGPHLDFRIQLMPHLLAFENEPAPQQQPHLLNQEPSIQLRLLVVGLHISYLLPIGTQGFFRNMTRDPEAAQLPLLRFQSIISPKTIYKFIATVTRPIQNVDRQL